MLRIAKFLTQFHCSNLNFVENDEPADTEVRTVDFPCVPVFFSEPTLLESASGAPPSGEPPARADCFEKGGKKRFVNVFSRMVDVEAPGVIERRRRLLSE